MNRPETFPLPMSAEETCEMCFGTGCPCEQWRDWWSMDDCECGCPRCGLEPPTDETAVPAPHERRSRMSDEQVIYGKPIPWYRLNGWIAEAGIGDFMRHRFVILSIPIIRSPWIYTGPLDDLEGSGGRTP